MSSIVISVENVSKKYQIGSYDSRTLRDDARRWWAGIRGLPDPTIKIDEISHNAHVNETLWALNKVSFEIKAGEAVGIIGLNGAGKSTLLKILSRITLPTEGKIKIKGKIASLLEVGTGFHPELTGRENIFLNGSILGMKRAEISRKIDEIVDFSGIEKFIDTPVKRYSSGMYMRLAFSVAAHLDSDILILDEVLSVGDGTFQKKSMAKMVDIYSEGRTVLFVSHSINAVRHLCQRAIYLKAGQVISDDKVEKTTDLYMDSMQGPAEAAVSVKEMIVNLPSDPAFRFIDIQILQNGQLIKGKLGNGGTVDVNIEYEVLEPIEGARVFFDICDSEGNIASRSFHDDDADKIEITQTGRYVSRVSIPANVLNPGKYSLVFDAGAFNVRTFTPHGLQVPLDVFANGRKNRAYVNDVHRGSLGLLLPWETKKLK
jgi:lipopolysaccharide transport system ATP-binding protein